MATTDTRRGDPAFAGDDRITHEPVVEEERESPLPDGETVRSPFPWAIGLVALAFVAAGVVAGAAAGWAYTIPFAVVGVLVFGFALTQRKLDRKVEGTENR
jgi:heme A synthase